MHDGVGFDAPLRVRVIDMTRSCAGAEGASTDLMRPHRHGTSVTWEDLFERARGYDRTERAVRNALAERRNDD